MPHLRLTTGPTRFTHASALRVDTRAAPVLLGATWGVAISLLPLYVGESGGVQPSHAVMAFAALGTLIRYATRLDRLCLLMTLFSIVPICRCLYEVASTGDPREMLPSLFLLFNAVVLISLREFLEQGRGIQYVRSGILGALTVAVAGLAIPDVREAAEAGSRVAGTFNNPNQLGYCSTCLLSLLHVLFLRGSLTRRRTALGVIATMLLAIVSLSKAALIANGVGIVLTPVAFRRSSLWTTVGLLGLSLLPMIVVTMVENGAFDDVPAVQRLRRIGQDSDDSAEARGYGLIASADPFIILFGRGSTDILDELGHEVHSSVGSVWVSFGAIGGLLLIAVLWEWCRTLVARHGVVATMAVSLPPLLYGLTHNGTRATLFWVLIAVSVAGKTTNTGNIARRQA